MATVSTTEPDVGGPGLDESDAPPPTGWRRWLRRLREGQSIWIVVALAALVVTFGILRPTEFLASFNIRSLAIDASVLVVLALGQTFVIITAGIDLSVGSVLVFSSVVGAKAMSALGGTGGGTGAILVGLLVCLVSSTAWGALNGVLVARFRVPALIVTLGTLGMALGFAQLLTDGLDVRDVPGSLTSSIGFGDAPLGIPWLVLIAAVVVLVGGWLLHTTRFGLRTYAIGSQPEAARRVGIAVDRHLVKVYALSGLCAGIAGFMALAKFGTTTIGGHGDDNLQAITAVVLGGTSLFGGVGTVLGTVIGVFIPAVLANGLVILDVQPFWQGVAIGAVLIVAVYWDRLRRAAREQR